VLVWYGPGTARGDGRTSKKGQAYGNRDERESSCSVLPDHNPPCFEAGCGYGSEPVSLVWGHRPLARMGAGTNVSYHVSPGHAIRTAPAFLVSLLEAGAPAMVGIHDTPRSGVLAW
jgi:hypothetical protein